MIQFSKILKFTALSILIGITASNVFAFTVPVAGDPFFEAYDFIGNDMILGVPGVLGALGLSVMGITQLTQGSIIKGMLPFGAGVMVYNLESIITSFGALVV
jgi:hypothetical protein